MSREDLHYYLRAAANALLVVRMVRGFPRFMANRLGVIREAETVYHLRNGMSVRLRNRTADFLVLREVIGRGCYFRRGFEVRSGETIIEIGGHIGLFTVAAARRAVPGSVYVFEPDPENARLLRENVRLNNLANVSIQEAAVAGVAGRRTLYRDPANTAGHTLYPLSGGSAPVQVETVRLSDFLRERGIAKVDYLKMDCEGAEYEILQSLQDADLGRIERLAIEVHDTGGNAGEALLSLLERQGYHLSKRAIHSDSFGPVDEIRRRSVRSAGFLLYAHR